MTTPAELQAIRERDDELRDYEVQDLSWATKDRRTLLALYDAQSDEVRRIKAAYDRYARHLPDCEQRRDTISQMSPNALPCNCGFDTALGGQP